MDTTRTAMMQSLDTRKTSGPKNIENIGHFGDIFERDFAPEANALSRLSYGRSTYIIAESIVSGNVTNRYTVRNAPFYTPIEQVLDSNRTTEGKRQR